MRERGAGHGAARFSWWILAFWAGASALILLQRDGWSTAPSWGSGVDAGLRGAVLAFVVPPLIWRARGVLDAAERRFFRGAGILVLALSVSLVLFLLLGPGPGGVSGFTEGVAYSVVGGFVIAAWQLRKWRPGAERPEPIDWSGGGV